MGVIETNRRIAALGLLSMVLGAIVKGPYRNYVYSHSIKDFGAADSLPSFFFAASIVLLGLSLQRRIRQWGTPMSTTLALVTGLLLYEFEQMRLLGRTFDWKDVIATVLGGLVAYFVYEYDIYSKRVLSHRENNPAR